MKRHFEEALNEPEGHVIRIYVAHVVVSLSAVKCFRYIVTQFDRKYSEF